jgi:hypothetical protein
MSKDQPSFEHLAAPGRGRLQRISYHLLSFVAPIIFVKKRNYSRELLPKKKKVIETSFGFLWWLNLAERMRGEKSVGKETKRQ